MSSTVTADAPPASTEDQVRIRLFSSYDSPRRAHRLKEILITYHPTIYPALAGLDRWFNDYEQLPFDTDGEYRPEESDLSRHVGEAFRVTELAFRGDESTEDAPGEVIYFRARSVTNPDVYITIHPGKKHIIVGGE